MESPSGPRACHMHARATDLNRGRRGLECKKEVCESGVVVGGVWGRPLGGVRVACASYRSEPGASGLREKRKRSEKRRVLSGGCRVALWRMHARDTDLNRGHPALKKREKGVRRERWRRGG